MSNLVWVNDKDEDGDHWLLSRKQDTTKGWARRLEMKPISDDDPIALDDLVEMMQQDAEGANYHDMISVYGDLEDILLRHCGYSQACAIMREIAEGGGFHGR